MGRAKAEVAVREKMLSKRVTSMLEHHLAYHLSHHLALLHLDAAILERRYLASLGDLRSLLKTQRRGCCPFCFNSQGKLLPFDTEGLKNTKWTCNLQSFEASGDCGGCGVTKETVDLEAAYRLCLARALYCPSGWSASNSRKSPWQASPGVTQNLVKPMRLERRQLHSINCRFLCFLLACLLACFPGWIGLAGQVGSCLQTNTLSGV